MDITVLTAGLLSLLMAVGHESIGVVWVLPKLDQEHLPQTPFGPQSMTDGMIRVTWHVVTFFLMATGVVLVLIAGGESSEARNLFLRSLAVMWLVAAVMASVVVRFSWKKLRRLPVPLIWVLVAVLCWVGST